MTNPDRLSGLDSAFLHLERGGAHMHVASIMVFAGSAPPYDEFMRFLESRLDRVPRYRQRLAFVPFEQGRPVWVDDPHFNLRYHLRHSALPSPGEDAQLAALAGRLFADRLDRDKPLWEMNLVEGLSADSDGQPRFAVIVKTHHALVDGVSGVDITSVLFSVDPNEQQSERSSDWVPRPLPTTADLVGDALTERFSDPSELARAARAVVRSPRRVITELGGKIEQTGALAWAGVRSAPQTPLNQPIGPHRRYGWVNASLATFKHVKNGLDGTINDAVLTTVSLGLGRWLRRRGMDTAGLTLTAMVPVSVRTEGESGQLGNRVSALWAPLPVYEEDPAAAFSYISKKMGDLKDSDQAVGADTLTELAGFAPPTIASQAARLQSRQRLFNLVVTNVPGPQVPLYLLGRQLTALYPVVPLTTNTALGVAAMSYCGRLSFGLLADYDALPDLGDVVTDFKGALFDLARAAETDLHRWDSADHESLFSAHTPDGETLSTV
ncbi:MAG: wax ester/triacylglycerol synthase family O-acyltransferase [Actinomycetes bacterium]